MDMDLAQTADGLITVLAGNPILLLFVVAAIGYPLGRIHVGGVNLGVASVLFAGLIVGAIDPRLRLPELIYSIGLVLFVYTVGLSSAPGFFASLRGRGLRNNLLVGAMLLWAAALTAGAHALLGIAAPQAAGLFAGSLTNTPALAGVVEYLQGSGAQGADLTDPVVGYSLAYPVSVLGMILAIYLAQRLWHIDYAAEARQGLAGLPAAAAQPLESFTIRVGNHIPSGTAIRDLVAAEHWDVLFTRVRHDGLTALATEHTCLAPGDLVTVLGRPDELARVTGYLGVPSSEQLEFDASAFDLRRLFVSSPRIVGHRLADLHLPQKYGLIVTRVRRGDVELLPHGDTVLELGDQVRIVTARTNLAAAAAVFGDSYRALSEIDILSFSLGLAAGLILGLLPIPLPGGITLKLGIAGGPLVVALILGARGRTGPIIWTLPYSANLMLRQLGLILFLAGIGTRAGYDFWHTLVGGGGLIVLGAATVIVLSTALLALWLGYRVLHLPMGILTGIIAGLQTQPATLGFALEQAGNEGPNIGYATVYPLAMIGKILLAQALLVLLR